MSDNTEWICREGAKKDYFFFRSLDILRVAKSFYLKVGYCQTFNVAMFTPIFGSKPLWRYATLQRMGHNTKITLRKMMGFYIMDWKTGNSFGILYGWVSIMHLH